MENEEYICFKRLKEVNRTPTVIKGKLKNKKEKAMKDGNTTSK